MGEAPFLPFPGGEAGKGTEADPRPAGPRHPRPQSGSLNSLFRSCEESHGQWSSSAAFRALFTCGEVAPLVRFLLPPPATCGLVGEGCQRRGAGLLGKEQPLSSRPGKPPLMGLYRLASVHYVAAFHSVSGLLKFQWPKWQGSLGFQDVDITPP